MCNQMVPGSFHVEEFTAPDKGREVGHSGILDAGSVNIIACNWAGGPTGTVKYVFTFAK